MAKTTHVNADQSAPYELNQSNHTWIFGDSVDIDGDGYPIHQDSDLSNDTIIVNALVYASKTDTSGIFFEGTSSKIVVGALGQVQGDQSGIRTTGGGMTVENDGMVGSVNGGAAIDVEGANAHVTNNGTLTGVTGIYLNSDDGVLVNNGHIYGYGLGIDLQGNKLSATLGKDSTVTGYNVGVEVETNAGEKSTVTNSGIIGMGNNIAYEAQDGDDTFINHGTVYGKVSLGDGDDVFNNLDGKFTGTVDGGLGDDTYIVNSAKTVIVDANDSGTDTVKSIVSYSLAGSALANGQIENLTLLGTKNLHGSGNALDNVLIGNSGNNVLDAGAGMDTVTGGKGDDTFVFATGHETDTITDFGKGADKIDLSGCTDIADFKDLMAHHVTSSNGDVHIASGMMDELILQNVAVADLNKGDFIFA